MELWELWALWVSSAGVQTGAASLLLKGLKCKPLRTGCPWQVPEPLPITRVGTTAIICPHGTAHAGGHWAKQEWSGQRGEWASSPGRYRGSARGCGGAKCLTCAGEGLASTSLSDKGPCPCGAHDAFHPGQVQISLPVCTQLVAIAAPWTGVSLSMLIYEKHKVA